MQTLNRGVSIGRLCAMPRRHDVERAIRMNARLQDVAHSAFLLFGQSRAVKVECQIDARAYFVDILPARTAASRKPKPKTNVGNPLNQIGSDRVSGIGIAY